MIGLDTNVLVRFITQDHPVQARAANRLIRDNCSADQPGRVDTVVLCELVWVLEGAYGYGRDVVSGILRQMLSTAELRVESPSLAWQAVKSYENDAADFADYLIALKNRADGCTTTFTFDRKAARSPWHKPVTAG